MPAGRKSGLFHCVCCYLMAAILLVFATFYFLDQVLSWFHGMRIPAFSGQQIAVVVPSDDRTIEVCVRDFACVDGDEIELELNADSVFRGELFREAICEEKLSVNEGSNPIVMTALNGSGGKGGCPNNINTGEVKIISPNQQEHTYAWRQLAGETASATIEVSIEN